MTRKMQPSPAQRKVLQALRDGTRLAADAERRVTIRACIHAGWTRDGELTALGRDALEQCAAAEQRSAA